MRKQGCRNFNFVTNSHQIGQRYVYYCSTIPGADHHKDSMLHCYVAVLYMCCHTLAHTLTADLYGLDIALHTARHSQLGPARQLLGLLLLLGLGLCIA